jgi:alpha-D-ribose 1-methylphosphonate 5-triphosphate diphosphatase PhnM
MTFGQHGGPPASPKQMQYLESLMARAGFTGFAEARIALGLTQKQARGRFTGKEASVLIDTLLEAQKNVEEKGDFSIAARTDVATDTAQLRKEQVAEERRLLEQAHLLKSITADLLADELRRRGWNVTEP